MVRKIAIVIVASLLAAFVWLNWSALSAATPISLGWTTVQAPLGLVLLVRCSCCACFSRPGRFPCTLASCATCA
jgi:hypothetical protein